MIQIPTDLLASVLPLPVQFNLHIAAKIMISKPEVDNLFHHFETLWWLLIIRVKSRLPSYKTPSSLAPPCHTDLISCYSTPSLPATMAFFFFFSFIFSKSQLLLYSPCTANFFLITRISLDITSPCREHPLSVTGCHINLLYFVFKLLWLSEFIFYKIYFLVFSPLHPHTHLVLFCSLWYFHVQELCLARSSLSANNSNEF